MGSNISAVEVFKILLNNIQEAQVPLILLRPREISESISYTGDYDFFMSPKFNDTLLKIVLDTAVSTSSSFIVTRAKHGKMDVTLLNSEDGESIALEIWNILSVKDPLKKTLRYIYPHKLSQYINSDDKGKLSLSLEIEALYYLSHLHTGRKKITTPLVKERILYYREVLQNSNSQYSVFFDDLIQEKLKFKEVAHKANMILVEKGLLDLKTDFSANIKEILIKASSTLMRIKQTLFSKIRLIPVIGPDGVGKTTIIEEVQKSVQKDIGVFKFKKTFRVSPIYKIFFPLLRYMFKKELNTKKQIGKSEVDDRYGNFVIFNAILLFPLRLIKNLFSRQFVFVDRYFHEHLMINARNKSKKSALRSDWKFWLALIPRTYMIVQLDAPTKVILQRKNELDEDSIDAYRSYLFQTFLEKPFIVYCYINTNIAPEKCRNLLIKVCKNKVKCS